MINIKGKYNSAKIFLEESQIEEGLMQHIYNICNNPAFSGNDTIRIMPDVHIGAGGYPIGFTMKFTDRIDPRCVSVDIGCGVKTVKLDAKVEDINIPQLDQMIQRDIPLGTNVNEKLFDIDKEFYKTYLNVDDKYIKDFCKRIDMKESRFWESISSLGGGNHFIELSTDINKNIWATVHTGSRNLGVKVCSYHTNIMHNNSLDKEKFNILFKEGITKIKAKYKGKQIQIQIDLLNESLRQQFMNKVEYLEKDNLSNYLTDMKLCQKYASLNRYMLIKRIVELTGFEIIDEVESIHNYIDLDNNIIRKGAISAQNGEIVVIPLNMRDGSIIAKGKGNSKWNYSAPHGAGRIMSRSKAKKEIDMDLYKLSMEGIYSTCINESTIDESPFAYKDPELIIDAIEDTVELIEIIHPILNIKAGE